MTSTIALAGAIAIGALAVGIALFFKVWWAGIICVAISLVAGVVAVLAFMTYSAERRKTARFAESERALEERELDELIKANNAIAHGDVDAPQASVTEEAQNTDIDKNNI